MMSLESGLPFELCDWQKALCLGSIMWSPPHTRLGSRHSYRWQPHWRELSVHPRRKKPASQLEYAPKLLKQCSSHSQFSKTWLNWSTLLPQLSLRYLDLYLPVQTWIQMLQVSKTSQKQSQELLYIKSSFKFWGFQTAQRCQALGLRSQAVAGKLWNHHVRAISRLK